MRKSRFVAGAAVLCAVSCAIFALPYAAHAQAEYGGEGIGSATSSDPLMHQGVVHAGVDDIASRAMKESAFKIIKDVKLGLKDADPNVRVAELNKLRELDDPDVNRILIQSMSDPDIRVKMKAVDILGAREANDAVGALSQVLFLRQTEPAVKLHSVAALGRIGDAKGALPVMQYMQEETDDRARGTAVFALGEIGNGKASPLLIKAAENDKSPMVRRLSKEALEKIDGELPTQHSTQIATTKTNSDTTPTDQKLAKLREYDTKLQEEQR
ncbi:MAG TPA: HEAT repeat domain-containing protein [Candidatus Binataceae bacterium]|nr:HEAT repeat domain-containing protein [Candidatus Binataceae bacterium]